MSNTPSDTKEEFQYRAQMQQLLHLIVHSLYTDKEVFLRELISNASDALSKVRFLSLSNPDIPEADYKITIALDPDASALTIEDNGIGMTREELIERLGTIASSGTLSFLQQMQESEQPLDTALIGQFGVGFYASFMVAGKVVVETRHATSEGPGHRWVSNGSENYSIEEIDRTDHGTTITLHLKEEEKAFSEEYRVQHIIRKYSNFVDFPIFVGDTQVNTVQPLWRKRKADVSNEDRQAFYRFITNDFQDPLGHLHLHIEGLVNFDALLFIPTKAPSSLWHADYDQHVHLYSSGVMIQRDAKHMLPDYLRFVRGVIDTEDLPLNVSREVTQHSPHAEKFGTSSPGKSSACCRNGPPKRTRNALTRSPKSSVPPLSTAYPVIPNGAMS